MVDDLCDYFAVKGPCYKEVTLYIDALVQDCNNSSVLAMELLQSCTKSLIYVFLDTFLYMCEWHICIHALNHWIY